MSKFSIDFFELSFLAEACIPPRPIARSMFWNNLTDVYWEQMSEQERASLFAWMNRNDYYKESLEREEDTQIFHSRFNQDNQYIVKTKYKRKTESHRAFKRNDRYYIGTTKFIAEEYIIGTEKIIFIKL
mgnify:FL=1